MTTFWYRSWLFGSFNWPWLPSWIGFFTARWQWQHVRAARARSSKQNTRANSVFCLHKWSSIKSRAINGFNKCVFGFYSYWKVWYKSEKAFGMCSEWHYTTRGLAYGDTANLPRCVMPFWTHAHAFSLYDFESLYTKIMHGLPGATFWSQVELFVNDFREWRSHELKSLANC